MNILRTTIMALEVIFAPLAANNYRIRLLEDPPNQERIGGIAWLREGKIIRCKCLPSITMIVPDKFSACSEMGS
jgi:hypothetical protein